MAVRDWIWLWPVALVTVTATAIPIGFRLARPPAAVPEPRYPVRVTLPPAVAGSGAAGSSAIEFDAAGWDNRSQAGGSAIAIRKSVWIAGAEVGSATIRVGARSELSVGADELRQLLAAAGRDTMARTVGGGRDGFVGFDELRGQGIDLRYDAAADRVVVAE